MATREVSRNDKGPWRLATISSSGLSVALHDTLHRPKSLTHVSTKLKPPTEYSNRVPNRTSATTTSPRSVRVGLPKHSKDPTPSREPRRPVYDTLSNPNETPRVLESQRKGPVIFLLSSSLKGCLSRSVRFGYDSSRVAACTRARLPWLSSTLSTWSKMKTRVSTTRQKPNGAV